MASKSGAIDACEPMTRGWFLVELIICFIAIFFAFLSIAFGWVSPKT